MVDYTYRRLVDIGPPEAAGPLIAERLRTLATLRGVAEPLRGALFQTATGAGLDVHTTDDSFGGAGPGGGGPVHRKVEPGQQANWRDGVVRTVIVITDEPYEEDTGGEPAYAEVIAALKAKDIHVIGIQWEPPVSHLDADPRTDHATVKRLQLRLQLQSIARDTGTVAPRGGVDCDGGGSPDVPEGQPVVCAIAEDGLREELDDMLVSIMRSLSAPDVQPVRLVPRPTGGLSVSLEGPDPEPRDVRVASEVGRTAVLGCTEEQAGRRYAIEFDLEVGGRVLDTLKGAAQCGEIPAAVVPPGRSRRAARPDAQPAPQPPSAAPAQPAPASAAPAPAPNAQPAAAAAPPPAPPAPAPVSSAPAQAPAQAPSAAANFGASAQDSPEPSVRAATVSTADEAPGARAAGEYAMVARPTGRAAVPAPALVPLGAGLSGLLLFVAVGRRRRVVPAVVPVRVRR